LNHSRIFTDSLFFRYQTVKTKLLYKLVTIDHDMICNAASDTDYVTIDLQRFVSGQPKDQTTKKNKREVIKKRTRNKH